METINLGGLKRKLDVRDIKLTCIQSPEPYPETYLADLNIVKKFQNGHPDCYANAGAVLKEIQENIEGQPANLSVRYLLTRIKQIDGYPLEVGSDMRSTLKVLASKGVCDEALLPTPDFSMPYTYEGYANPSALTPEMDDDALPRTIKAYGFEDNPSFELIKQLTYQNKVILARIVVDEGFFRTANPTFTVPRWGHLVAIVGYTENAVIIQDSTEENLDLSLKYINKKYITPQFLTEVGTAIDADTIKIRQMIKQKEILQKIVALYQKILALLK